ncbi:MAG TPA: TPM domain-containing protein [Chitinophagaceae bacterium]|nr:TPM domain-containing protein [Chitinophagaceae bacterium]
MKKGTLKILGSLCFIMLIGLQLAHTATFPKSPNPPRFVNDFAAILNAEERNNLEKQLEDLERESGNELTIVTIASLGGYDPSLYAAELGEYWGVGKAKYDNGVLILVAFEDRKMAISAGRGVEGGLTDLRAGRIIREVLTPAFRKGEYYRGLTDASNILGEIMKGEYNEKESFSNNQNKNSPVFVLIFVIVFLLIVFIAGSKGNDGDNRGGGRKQYHNGGSDILTGVFLGSMMGRRSGGLGGGYGSGSSGGFGGFGGGSFGGGGASGSW